MGANIDWSSLAFWEAASVGFPPPGGGEDAWSCAWHGADSNRKVRITGNVRFAFFLIMSLLPEKESDKSLASNNCAPHGARQFLAELDFGMRSVQAPPNTSVSPRMCESEDDACSLSHNRVEVVLAIATV